MPVDLFGFRIGKKPEDEQSPSVQSFAPPPNDDGAIAVSEGGVFGTTVDMDGSVKNEGTLISRYRDMAQQPECERAIDDIVNEALIFDERKLPVAIVLDEVENMPDKLKESIRAEFDGILKLLHFDTKAYEIFKNWYVDGRIYFHLMIDAKKPRLGIQELRFVDPRKIKKVRVEKRNNKNIAPTQDNQVIGKVYDEYFLYSPKGMMNGTNGIKISSDSIAYAHSGIQSTKNDMVLSHMHKAIKPLNQLRMLEDATVIYRLARAPERRIFYIDVGNLPKAKAEQYLRDMMAKHKNKLVYDANTGEVRDDRKFMTMLEDYWLPRREGGKGTEITTLPPGQNLGELDDVIYFRKKLYEALNVPVSRLENETTFNLGRSSEISRDEVKFTRFITRLRSRFNDLFMTLLERQLLLKGIITRAEWKEMRGDIHYDYLEDNHFTELKDAEILQTRLQMLAEADQFVGKYFSVEWVRKNVLYQTEEDIDEIVSQMEDEEPKDTDSEPEF
jgi:hypothetical protein